MSVDTSESQLFRLIFLALRDLALAILIGTLIFLPFYAFNEIHTVTKITSEFSALPGDDLALESWYRENGLRDAKIERRENKLTITYQKGLRENPNADWVFPSPETLAALGYTRQANLKFSDEFNPSFDLLAFFPIVIACSQIGFLAVGWRRMRRLRKDSRPLHSEIREATAGRILLTGILAGLAIILFGFLYDLAWRKLFGFPPGISGIWNGSKSLSPASRVFIIFAGVIVAPLCEEIFFRGAVFKSFAQKGTVVYGVLFSSALFAVAHFDPYAFPVYFVFGSVLAIAYSKTNSLAAPVIAHALNNAVAFYLLYA